MRIMGIDYGTKTIGVAISDPLCIIAKNVETIYRNGNKNKIRKSLRRLEYIINIYYVKKIILGLPKTMLNNIGSFALETINFKKILKKRFGLPVIMWDERLTTIEAKHVLNKMNIQQKNRYKYIDMISATFILQSYLNTKYK